MALDVDRLADKMLEAWNDIGVDEKTINTMGDRMYNSAMYIKMDQTSDPDGELGRKRFRMMAREIIANILNDHGTTSRARFHALAECIINEIRENATIQPLAVSGSATVLGIKKIK